MGRQGQLLAGDKALQIKACALLQWLLASERVCGPVCRSIWRSTVDNSGSLAVAAIMKKWRNGPYSSLGLGPKPWFSK